MKSTQMEDAIMKTLIPGALVVGCLLGFFAGPMLASAGITMLAIYLTFVGVLVVCNLVAQ